MTTTKQYDSLNRLTSIISTTNTGGGVVGSFNYTYNPANQRTRDSLSDGSYWRYEYDSLGQVKSGKKYWSDGTPVAGQQFEYSFDDIGNRTGTKSGGDASGGNLRSASYTVNALNQYLQREVPGTNDVIGVAIATNAVTVNRMAAYRHGEYYQGVAGSNNTVISIWQPATNACGANSVIGNFFIAKTPELFTNDLDGNLLSDGRWTNRWDAENRLVSMTSLNSTPSASRLSLKFEYDWKGRRLSKVVSNWTGSAWSFISSNRFVYDGWNLMAELNQSGSLVRSFVWGTDLSGTMQGAGGVGGLLESSCYGSAGTGTTNCFAAFDGNGNVMALVNAADGTVLANYDYAPFGEVIRATGAMAKGNPMRFSTKYQDDETDLLYYGYRYYNPSTGRWLRRDPIGETGGINLYVTCGNDLNDSLDFLGLVSQVDPWNIPPTPPEPPTGNPGWHDFPPSYYHPANEGKPCCCTPPGEVKTFERTDSPPTRFHLNMSFNIELTGCWKDLQIFWWTCWRPNGSSGNMPGFEGSTSATLSVAGITLPGGINISTGPHITNARIVFLACEKGKWTRHMEMRSRTYLWNNGQWTW